MEKYSVEEALKNAKTETLREIIEFLSKELVKRNELSQHNCDKIVRALHDKEKKGKAIVCIMDEVQPNTTLKYWAKVLSHVNRNVANGYAFEGKFINMFQKNELEIGTLILVYTEVGVPARRKPVIHLFRVGENGLELVFSRGCSMSWALEIRDDVAAILEQNDE